MVCERAGGDIECECKAGVGAAGLLRAKQENRLDFETSCYLYATCPRNNTQQAQANTLKYMAIPAGLHQSIEINCLAKSLGN
jgi:hypothetical protein